MGELAIGLAWALGLGIYTSVTPCPLATNIAAISYISRRVGNSRAVLLTGLLYALGRTLVYTVLGVLLVASLLASDVVSSFLREYMNELLGPLLILVGMFLLGLIQVGVSGPGVSEKLQKRVDAMGIWGALLLGVVFAMSFCPISAGLFFLTLIPEAVRLESRVGLPSLYGVGTAVPVVAFALVVAFSAQSLGKAYNRVTQIEWWVRRISGALFLAVGVYFTLRFIFDLSIQQDGSFWRVSIRLWS
jgi:cytochrome c-type biogenesis protein